MNVSGANPPSVLEPALRNLKEGGQKKNDPPSPPFQISGETFESTGGNCDSIWCQFDAKFFGKVEDKRFSREGGKFGIWKGDLTFQQQTSSFRRIQLNSRCV